MKTQRNISKWAIPLLGGALIAIAATAGDPFSDESAPKVAEPREAEQGPSAEFDPFDDTEGSCPPRNLLIRVETWEIPALDLAGLLDRLDEPETLPELRSELLAGKTDTRMVHSSSVSCRPGQKATSEVITERVYPPPRFKAPPAPPAAPNSAPSAEGKTTNVGKGQTQPKGAGQANDTEKFETRNTGVTLEVEARPSKDGSWCDLRFAPERVELLGPESFETEHLLVRPAQFYTFRVSSGVKLREGKWHLVQSQSPAPGTDGDRPMGWFTIVTYQLERD